VQLAVGHPATTLGVFYHVFCSPQDSLKERSLMAFTDPQTVTFNAVATPLPRTSFAAHSGEFAKDDGLLKLSFSHAFGRKTRRLVQLDHSKIAADPLQASVNVRLGARAYMVVETPPYGYTVAEAKQLVDALTGYLAASTGARATQWLGGEI